MSSAGGASGQSVGQLDGESQRQERHPGHPAAAPRGAWLQIGYLNSYYERIRAHVGPELRRQRLEDAYAWLQESTEPFPVSGAGTATAGLLALASLLSVLLSGLGA